MMEHSQLQTPIATVHRSSGRRVRHVDRLDFDEEREGWSKTGEIDEDFDAVDIDDVVREARGGRQPVVETDSL